MKPSPLDLYLIRRDQNFVLKKMESGDVDDIVVNSMTAIDELISFGLGQGFLKDILKSFPDPRKSFDIPMEVLILPQIMQRINNEHSLSSSPYMLSSTQLLDLLGYNAVLAKNGFNNKNIYERETCFNGETLKHVLLSSKADEIVSWFNKEARRIFSKSVAGRTRVYIIDGTKLELPLEKVSSCQNAGVVKDGNDNVTGGYKVVWIRELLDQKGMIVAMKIVPINRHDVDVAKELLEEIEFEKGSVLIMDRGFFDGDWIDYLHEKKGLDICIPFKKNFVSSQYAYANLSAKNRWRAHPTRPGQEIAEIELEDLKWDKCQSFESGVCVRWNNEKTGEWDFVIFADTRKQRKAEQILEVYDLRSEIEEDHKQLKCFQLIEKQPSKKFTQVVFRLIMGVLGFNLFNIYTNFVSNKNKSLKTFRQRKKNEVERNPKVTVYAEGCFAIIELRDLILKIIDMPIDIQKKFKSIVSQI